MNTNEDNKNDKPNQPAPVSAEALDDNIRAAYIEGYGDAAHDIAEGKSGDLLERGPAAWEMSLARKMLLSKQPAASAPVSSAAPGAAKFIGVLSECAKAISYNPSYKDLSKRVAELIESLKAAKPSDESAEAAMQTAYDCIGYPSKENLEKASAALFPFVNEFQHKPSKQPAPSVQAAEGAGADTIRLNWLDKATSYEWNSLLSNVNVPIRDTIDAEMGELTAKPEEKREITDKDIERIENIVGIGCGAWDTIDPKKLVAAVLQWKEEIK